MDQGAEVGNAFAIPDLWKESSLVDFTHDATSPEAGELQPLSCQPLHIHGRR